jgi:hypothetical protein
VSLEDLEREMIRGAQRELAPAPAVRERHEAELLSRLARGAPLASDTSGLRVIGGVLQGSGARAPWGLTRSPARMLGVGLAVGAMVGGMLGYSFGQRGTSAAQSGVTMAPSAAELTGGLAALGEPPATAPSEPPATAPSEPPIVAAPSESPDLPAAEPPALRAALAGPGSGGGGRPAKPLVRAPARENDGSESSLAAELAMLQRARRALAAENGQLALGLVQELDERFPTGVLIEERIATRVLGLCALERVDEAREVARDFLAHHPTSVYAERVRSSCVAAPE